MDNKKENYEKTMAELSAILKLSIKEIEKILKSVWHGGLKCDIIILTEGNGQKIEYSFLRKEGWKPWH